MITIVKNIGRRSRAVVVRGEVADHVHADDGGKPAREGYVGRAAGMHGDAPGGTAVGQPGQQDAAQLRGRLDGEDVVGQRVPQHIGAQPGAGPQLQYRPGRRVDAAEGCGEPGSRSSPTSGR